MGWVFGYGSLMWNPGFPCKQSIPAVLEGYTRDFCRLSFRHRGTRENPGMVLGLVPGGSCQGVALEFQDEEEALSYLDAREGVGYFREQSELTLLTPGSPTLKAWVYIPHPDHPTYVPDISLEQKAGYISAGVGESGSAVEYLENLMGQLKDMGIQDPGLENLLAKTQKNSLGF